MGFGLFVSPAPEIKRPHPLVFRKCRLKLPPSSPMVSGDLLVFGRLEGKKRVFQRRPKKVFSFLILLFILFMSLDHSRIGGLAHSGLGGLRTRVFSLLVGFGPGKGISPRDMS